MANFHHKRLVGYDYEEKNGMYFIYEVFDLIGDEDPQRVKELYRKTKSLRVARRVSNMEETSCLNLSVE